MDDPGRGGQTVQRDPEPRRLARIHHRNRLATADRNVSRRFSGKAAVHRHADLPGVILVEKHHAAEQAGTERGVHRRQDRPRIDLADPAQQKRRGTVLAALLFDPIADHGKGAFRKGFHLPDQLGAGDLRSGNELHGGKPLPCQRTPGFLHKPPGFIVPGNGNQNPLRFRKQLQAELDIRLQIVSTQHAGRIAEPADGL